MPISIPLDDFLQLMYGDNRNLNESVRKGITNMLGKNQIETLKDARAVIMTLDRQDFETAMVIRFSQEDIYYSQVNGVDCPVDHHDQSVSGPSASSGSFESHLLACFNKICFPGSVVLDIGANIGYTVLYLSKLAGESGHIYAFEPNSENCRMILLGLEHNRVQNTTLLPVALSDRRGWEYFSAHVGSNGGFVSQNHISAHGHGTVVPTFTLDEMNLPNVDVIKVDVEGAEYRVLKGGQALLTRSRPAIVCEFSMEMSQRVSGVAAADFLNWITGMDYRIHIIDRESFVPMPVDSVSAMLDTWGFLGRIEDLLFMPREKMGLIGGQ
jgi:FkbM family methyltransferase